MSKIPLTICLFTSTKGHFERKDIYLNTAKSLDSQIPLYYFENLVANIKYSKGEENQLEYMANNLEKLGFKVLCSNGDWSHQNQTHQNGYLLDIYNIYKSEEVLKSKYVWHLEDDWEVYCHERDIQHWINESLKLMDENPYLTQIRFARFANEFDRINKLKEKHGLNAFAIKEGNSGGFFQNDFSLNPSIFRPRDIFSAVNLVLKNPQVFEQHVEHGIGAAIKYLYDLDPLPFYCFDPEKIKVMHMGTPDGEQDTKEKLVSN